MIITYVPFCALDVPPRKVSCVLRRFSSTVQRRRDLTSANACFDEVERVMNLVAIAAVDAPDTKAQLAREAGMKRGAWLKGVAFAVQTAQPGNQRS
jgi:hypothetical protein